MVTLPLPAAAKTGKGVDNCILGNGNIEEIKVAIHNLWKIIAKNEIRVTKTKQETKQQTPGSAVTEAKLLTTN